MIKFFLLCFTCIALYLSTLMPAFAGDAKSCVKFDKSTLLLNNNCDTEVLVFWCEAQSCRGNRFYQHWMDLEPGRSAKASQIDIKYGACAGSFGNETHTKTQSYSCKDIGSSSSGSIANALSLIEKNKMQPKVDDAKSIVCPNGETISVTTKFIYNQDKPVAIKLKSGKSVYTMAIARDGAIYEDRINEASLSLCEIPTTLYQDFKQMILDKAIKSNKKLYIKPKQATGGVRG